MALAFQYNLTGLTNIDLFTTYIKNDEQIGDKYDCILFYDFDAEVIKLLFKVDLTADEVLHLDSLIANYVEILPQDIKIYRFVPLDSLQNYNKKVPPFGINYITGLTQRLYRQDTKDLGRIIKREFFGTQIQNGDGTVTLSDLIVEENYSYTYSPYHDVIERDIEISWYKEDGTPHDDKKHLIKNYTINLDEMLAESKRARVTFFDEFKLTIREVAIPSIIANEQIPQEILDEVGGSQELGAEMVLLNLLVTHQVEFTSFENEGNPAILTSITNDTEPLNVWLDNQYAPDGTTFREHIIEVFQEYLSQGIS